jgi:ribonuclease E
MKRGAAALAMVLPVPVALYVLNQKRDRLIGLEQRYQIKVGVQVDGELVAGEYRLETTEQRAAEEAPAQTAPQLEAAAAEPQEEEADAGRRRRRRRRRRRKPGEAEGEVEALETARPRGIPPAAPDIEPAEMSDEPAPVEPEDGDELPTAAAAAPDAPDVAPDRVEPAAAAGPPRRRARVRRRRTAPEHVGSADRAAAGVPAANTAADEDRALLPNGPEEPLPEVLATDQTVEAGIGLGASAVRAADNGHDDAGEPESPSPKLAAPRPRRRSRASRPTADEQPQLPEGTEALAFEPEEAPNEPDLAAAALVERRDSGPPRRGWWSRFVRKDE